MPPCRLEFSKCSAASNTLHASERVLSRACSGQRAAALHRLAVPRARRRPLARLYRGGGVQAYLERLGIVVMGPAGKDVMGPAGKEEGLQGKGKATCVPC